MIQVEHLQTRLGGQLIHHDVSFSVARGEIVALIGSSGCGKSTVLRVLLGLLKPAAGEARIFGKNPYALTPLEAEALARNYGMLFQQAALFSALTVLENIAFPLKQFTQLNQDTINEIALLKLLLVGLPVDAAHKYPAELSGGMQKRAALARALALEPKLLFLDEPSAGLDPVSAAAQEELLLDLKQALGLTILMVTHDLHTLATLVDKIIFLGEGKVLAEGSYTQLRNNPHPQIKEYFQYVAERMN